MDTNDKFPVFFECAHLNDDQRKRIESYFKIKRKSGGGECGSVTEVGGTVYSIAFKEQDAQQSVLQRSKHVLEIAGVTIVLNVRDNARPSTSSDNATVPPGPAGSPNLKLATTSPQQKQQSSIPPNLLTSSEEYELKRDIYIFRYLKESPKVKEELENQLALLSCTAELQPEEERILVRRVAQPGTVGEFKDWKSEVNKLFDGYKCHYEVDSHKVKALLQSYSSHQTTDKVKVYSEIGMAVVVGERYQVEARLTDLSSLCVKNRGSRSSDTQTTVRRIGEAKLRLLWKEIKCSLGQKFPTLKVTQADEGKIVLTGSVDELLKAGEVITEKEKLVFEKAIADKSPHFLAFLKKCYGGPGLLCDFLGVAEMVEAEIRDTTLHFFSLSADNLDDSVKKIQENFKDVRYDILNCPVVPPELCEKLKSKTNEMNQKQYRANVVFGADGTVCLLGHTEEVEELSETVSQFILDQTSMEGKVILPFRELVPLLPEFLQIQGFDYSDVTFSPEVSSSSPMVLLVGSSSKVTEVRNRLGPLLDSTVQNRVTIDLPGAARYFNSHSGRESLLKVAHSQKCLIQLEEQPHLSRENSTVAKYNLQHGLQMIVYQGDITKQYADGIVNAANEDLNHVGGVAAALSKAGGPQVQKECKVLVEQTGKIAVGEVVVTTGGDLKCKNLLHAVGPESGKASGRERVILEKTIRKALDLAELMEFKSIALPCISSGIYGVPIKVCSEAIVTAIKEFGSQGGRSLSKIILIDKRGEVVRALQEACDRLLPEKDLGFKVDVPDQEAASGATAEAPVQVEIVQGTIENQQVDAIVSPMVGHDPVSTRIGNTLSNMTGGQLEAKFHKEAGGATLPSESVVVEGLPGLKCKAVFFLNLLSWDNNQHGSAAQALRQGIKKILTTCNVRAYSSVTLPVLGTGSLLRFPNNVACRILLEEVSVFEQNQTRRSPFLVRIVVQPMDKESSKALQSAQGDLHLRGFTNDVNPAQASFYRHVSITNDEVTAMIGGVKLQILHGDIVAAGTDVIVNTTDFKNHQSGVSNAILTAAGPAVAAELAKVGIPADLICSTQPGLLGCKEIVHAGFKSDCDLIRKNCAKILKLCESKGFGSVAFPAINTGQGRLSSVDASKAMLDGLASTIRDMNPVSLSLIRVVILQQAVFKDFRSELESRFGLIVKSRLSLKDNARQKLKKLQEKFSRLSTSLFKQDQTFISPKPELTVLRVISCGPDVTKSVKKDLELIVQQELLERTVDVDSFYKLDKMELDAVRAKIKVTGISLEHKPVNAGRSRGRDQSGSGQEVYVLKGLKEDVFSVLELINKAVQKALKEDIKDKEEAMLALTIQWAMKDDKGQWQELSLCDNYMLEEAHLQKKVSVEMETPDGVTLKVNLNSLEATDWKTGKTYKLKRTESEALDLPSHWEPMHQDIFKKVELQPNSQEYQDVAKDFHRTTKYKIHKIERVQNVYLWNAFSLCRQRILTKNGLAELGEMQLYHGTSAESCNCIERNRFDRSYAGAHATAYGKGVYFAVNADYSANRYCPADPSGMKRLYVARVLTGRYTVGSSSMKAPPPRGSDPTDCFDSLVNNQQQPIMFVIFHDDQAYPEYLITFS
ncbi:protein mono-ADP-ribosyltransferase PARP14-like isoform X1 [Girardinichthys multiradiatus]|uniref:protein mono-ADP-ribosyltransferase PARP14-like isoform X1 n=1 Tax=Girardinichthys multiradiatus TaxID=208333 RepID=UPI001FADA21B|nr:protein mono-ADP-ribosyltransferase PARP14-like isoform X1 [Girardinichthys multiradiatus]